MSTYIDILPLTGDDSVQFFAVLVFSTAIAIIIPADNLIAEPNTHTTYEMYI